MIPVLFTIGSFEVSSFGVMMALGFLVGGWLAARSFEDRGLPSDMAWSLLTWAMIGGVLGSKLWFVGEQLARHPEQLELLFTTSGPLLTRGGLTWYGGLVGGAAAVLYGVRYQRLKLAGAGRPVPALTALTVANAVAPTLAIGQALGRVGCFLVGDDWGLATDVPWAMAYPHGVDPVDFPVHPTHLYEALWLGGATVLLWRRRLTSPCLIGEYLVLAGLGRLWIEVFRRNPSLFGVLTNAQLTALLCIALGVGLWLWSRRTADGASAGRKLSRDAPA